MKLNLLKSSSTLAALAAFALLLLSGGAASAQSSTLWRIGSLDHNNAEFALAPKNYSHFVEDGLFIVGQSEAKSAWPYVHPGPHDSWAGSRAHTFRIFFGVQSRGSAGTCRLVLELLDTHYRTPPTLLIQINGQSFERALPVGQSDDSIGGNPAAGKPCEVAVEFPASLLQAGNNHIELSSRDGSWFLYDGLRLESPASVQGAPVGELTVLTATRVVPGTVERAGKRSQRVEASVVHTGAPLKVSLRVGKLDSKAVLLQPGRQSLELEVPAVDGALSTLCSVMAGRRTLCSQPLTLVPGVEQIVVVFKTHFDIGYTDMASNVVQRYRGPMIDQALQVVEQNRDLPAQQQFAWTMAGWPMHQILQDWPGQTGQRVEQIEAALRQGRFVLHALPFSTHTELLEAEDLVRGLGYSSGLARSLGLELPHDAKMTDVPEHTWMMATLLKHAGVDFMMIGCNGASAPLQVPWLYWWQGPDGSRVLTFYSPDYGTQLEPPADWPYKTWLACLHTGDNHGPPRPEEVKRILEQAAQRFPGVKVRIGRLSDFGDAILAEKPKLPVVCQDTPDTWIHGPMSDPAGAKLARQTRPLLGATEALNTQLRAWGQPVPAATPAIQAAYEQSLLYGEHTWGGAIYWIGNRLSYGEDFQKERAQGRFSRLESSWEEHSGYIRKAAQLLAPELKANLQALAQGVQVEGPRIVVFNPLPWTRSGLVHIEQAGLNPAAVAATDGSDASRVQLSPEGLSFMAHDIPPMGYRTYVPRPAEGLAKASEGQSGPNSMESRFFKASLEPGRGIVGSLVDKRSGRELADSSSSLGLGQYLYERFDRDQVNQYCKAYVRPGMSYPDFFKPNQPPAEQVPYQALSPHNFSLRFEQKAHSLEATMEAAATTNLPAITTRLSLSREEPWAELELTIHNKPLEPWPEAGWLCLPLKVAQPQFHLGRLGSIIQPATDIVPGANRHIFGLNTGLSVTDSHGRGVGLCSLDSPLVSLQEPGCWKFSLDFVPKEPRVFVNLFNNQWDTNFRLWNQGSWSYRVRLWAVEHYSAQASLITPSLEARYPLLAGVAEGKPGSLPLSQAGVVVSRPGILVTAFGANPDGAGTILRLWEQSGQAGKAKVRLPQALKVSQAQPVDLRGRPVGPALPLKAGAFELEVGAFAPVSVLLKAAD